MPVYKVPVEIEGGNLLSNGNGIIVTTRRLLEDNEYLDYNDKDIKRIFRYNFGCTDVIFLEYLEGEESGHADMFATFTSLNTIVLGAYDPRLDMQNPALLNRNAKRLRNVKTTNGPLKVVHIPMPPKHDGIWRTYTNVIYSNGALLIPYYENIDPKGLEKAVSIYSALLPGWKIIKIEATEISKQGGALHCVGLNIGTRAN